LLYYANQSTKYIRFRTGNDESPIQITDD